MIDLKAVQSSAPVVRRLQHRSQYRMSVFELLLWHIHEKTVLLWWIGFQTCNFERSIAIWLPSFLQILIFFYFFSATTLSWLHLSWLWKFQSWQSRLFHRWNWCGKSRLFYQKGNLLKKNKNPSKYKKRPFAKKTQTYRALLQWFWFLKHFSPKNFKYVNRKLTH